MNAKSLSKLCTPGGKEARSSILLFSDKLCVFIENTDGGGFCDEANWEHRGGGSISISAPRPRHVSHINCDLSPLGKMSMSTIIKLSGEMKRKREKKRFSSLNAGLLTWDTLSSRHETVEIVIFTGTLTWMASPGVKWVINPPLTRWAPRNWWLVKTEVESWESWEERVRRHWSVSGEGEDAAVMRCHDVSRCHPEDSENIPRCREDSDGESRWEN